MSGRRPGHPDRHRPSAGSETTDRARLDAVYAQLPDIECRGKCWDSCGPIVMAASEHRRIAEAGFDITPSNYFRDGARLCPALTMLRRCAVYEIRPLICRLWGLTEWMPCNYGCRPVGGLLSDLVARELLAQVADIAGDTAQARQWRETPTAEYVGALRQVQEDEETRRMIRARRADRTGTAIYVYGPGRLGPTPPT